MKSTTILAIGGAIIAVFGIVALRGCEHIDDVFKGGTHVLEAIDWRGEDSSPHLDKVYGYVRTNPSGRLDVVTIVPYGERRKAAFISEGRDGNHNFVIRLLVTDDLGSPGGALLHTAADVELSGLDNVIVELAGGDGLGPIVISDADDESVHGLGTDSPVPVMRFERVGPTDLEIRGFTVLMDQSTVNLGPPSGTGLVTRMAAIATSGKDPAIWYLSVRFPDITADPHESFRVELVPDNNAGRTFTHPE